jgi:hypothetical protein
MRPSLVILVILLVAACSGSDQTAQLMELQRVKAGSMAVVLLAPGESLKQGKGRFVLEFQDADGNLMDVGSVMVGASMPMPGMAPMFGECLVTPSPTKGRYEVVSDLGMAGTWRLQVAWDGPAGKGSASVPGSVL